jgi:hypothetical protein
MHVTIIFDERDEPFAHINRTDPSFWDLEGPTRLWQQRHPHLISERWGPYPRKPALGPACRRPLGTCVRETICLLHDISILSLFLGSKRVISGWHKVYLGNSELSTVDHVPGFRGSDAGGDDAGVDPARVGLSGMGPLKWRWLLLMHCQASRVSM